MKAFFTSISLLLSISLFGQINVFKNLPDNYRQNDKPVTLGPLNDISKNVNSERLLSFKSFQVPKAIDFNLMDVKVKKIGNSIWIEGNPKEVKATVRHKYAPAFNYLKAIESRLPIQNTEKSFKVVHKQVDELGMSHYKMQQLFQGIPVFSGELILHETDQKITHANGRLFPVSENLATTPQITLDNALDHAYQNLGADREERKENKLLSYLNLDDNAELIIYPFEEQTYLAYHLEIHSAHNSHWKYFINAVDGEIINKYSTLCGFYGKELKKATQHKHFHKKTPNQNNDVDVKPGKSSRLKGPAVGNGVDLLGQNREVHSFEDGGTYFLVDASRRMFKNLGDQNNPPVGIIQTFDAQHKALDENLTNVVAITSNSADWNYPTAVSAHANAGIVYEYFKNTHSRESYNNQNGNLVSFINVVEKDNEGLDNAYWGGRAMFYGNGDFQFERLPAGLDVAAHEMGHGTIQTTAGLEYQFESGALNESFADIFGAMVDRDDWKIGDDVSLSSFFPSGTMRDMANPHNGGSRVGDPGYQPQFYNERFIGTIDQDNGGVHINSGIVNYVAYLIGETIGKDKLEQIYYRALAQYLTRSSQFIDCRNAVIQSATDLYGSNSSEAQVAAQAFDQAGIIEGQVEDNPDPQQDVETNEGAQVIAYIDTDDGRINLTLTDATDIAEGLTNFVPISRPSITDDGSVMVYVSDDNIMRYIAFDWNNESYDIGTIEQDPQSIWRNVVISKDGSKLAALTAQQDNNIYAIDLSSGNLQPFALTNPGTQEGIFNDNVLRADAMEFDFSGEFLMYDAESDLGSYTYWDIGFLHVWDNASNSFGSGQIFKLVEGLPETVSIGNPTFAKNSPYVIALDYVEIVEDRFFGPTPEYSVYGFNIETYEYADIVTGGNRLKYPNYGPADDYIMYTGVSSDIIFDGISTLFAAPLNPDKITFADIGDILQFKQYATWANWFAIGQRDFNTTSIEPNELAENKVKVFPNPTVQDIRVDFELNQSSQVRIEVLDLLGKVHYTFSDQMAPGQQQHRINMYDLSGGIYFVQMKIDGKLGSVKVLKE